MASVSNPAACSIRPDQRGVIDRLNAEWHKPALLSFTAIVLAHWAEHLVQAFQVYVLHWPLKESLGLLGMPFPWLVRSELMHYLYAIVMLIGIWVLRKGFVGRSRFWWMAAFWIQFWHHIEHALLQGQIIYGANFLGAPAPISVIQMLGLIEGTGSTGFNGLMAGPPAHAFTPLLLFVRRVEVHLFYNTVVFIPMVVAMYLHMFPLPEEEAHMACGCTWHKRPQLAGLAAG